MAIVQPPAPTLRHPILSEPVVEKFCSLPTAALVVPLSYNLVIIMAAAFYGYKTRKLPENFNESKCIFISVCSTLFLWVAFLPTYYTTSSTLNQAVLLAMSLILSSTVILITLFFTRIYAIYYVDESSIMFAATLQTSTRVGVTTPPTGVLNVATISSTTNHK